MFAQKSLYNIFSHFDIPTISTKEQRKISAFVEAKAATIATTGRAIRQPISLTGSDHSTHTNDWDGIILEDTPNDSRNPDPEIPDTISIQPSHAATGNTNIPTVEITSATPNGILDTTMDSIQSNTILDETMNSAHSEMSISTTAQPEDLDIANINITEDLGLSPLTDEQSEFSQQTDSQPSVTSVPSQATAASIRSKAQNKRRRKCKTKRIKKAQTKSKHKHPTSK